MTYKLKDNTQYTHDPSYLLTSEKELVKYIWSRCVLRDKGTNKIKIKTVKFNKRS